MYDVNRELQRMLNPPVQVPVMPRLLQFLYGRGKPRIGLPRIVPTQQLEAKRATRGLGYMGSRAPRKQYPFLGKI